MMTQPTQAKEKGTRLTIRIGDRDFVLERRQVPVTFLKLDPKNQRLSYQLGQLRKEGKIGTDAELHDVLWAMDPVKDLYQSVLQNGGLIQDPIAKEDGLVVEGNCRTVVLRELHKKFQKDDRFASLYVQILPPNFSEEQLVTLLGELHIAGKIEWRAYEQAEYVYKMSKQFGKTYDFLSAHLRWPRSKIAQKIAAYEETSVYLAETADPQGINRFSHFEEFMKKKELREKRQNDPKFMKTFRDWVHQGKFPDAKDIRLFPDVLSNPRAFKEFEQKGIQEAERILIESDPSRSSDFYWSIDQTTQKLRNTPLSELNDLGRGDAAKVAKLRDLHRALLDVAKTAAISLG
jgi:hypothetical protein